MSRRIEDYDFHLPAELIAQAPARRRDAARLLVLDRSTGATAHERFSRLPALLRRGDLLVLNDSAVRQARLFGRKAGTGGYI